MTITTVIKLCSINVSAKASIKQGNVIVCESSIRWFSIIVKIGIHISCSFSISGVVINIAQVEEFASRHQSNSFGSTRIVLNNRICFWASVLRSAAKYSSLLLLKGHPTSLNSSSRNSHCSCWKGPIILHEYISRCFPGSRGRRLQKPIRLLVDQRWKSGVVEVKLSGWGSH